MFYFSIQVSNDDSKMTNNIFRFNEPCRHIWHYPYFTTLYHWRHLWIRQLTIPYNLFPVKTSNWCLYQRNNTMAAPSRFIFNFGTVFRRISNHSFDITRNVPRTAFKPRIVGRGGLLLAGGVLLSQTTDKKSNKLKVGQRQSSLSVTHLEPLVLKLKVK